ncbi:MAG: hypothetical protein IK054_01820 [Lachnospiraceae bacterium]|nr:hypothetical protein [Lachnospiraceae bacterium]
MSEKVKIPSVESIMEEYKKQGTSFPWRFVTLHTGTMSTIRAFAAYTIYTKEQRS